MSVKQLKPVNYVHSTLKMKIKKIKLPKSKGTFMLGSIEDIVLKQGGGFPFWLGLFRHMWTQQSHSVVEQNNWAQTAFKRWSNFDSITTLEQLICSENTTALTIGTNSHDMCCLVTGAKWRLSIWTAWSHPLMCYCLHAALFDRAFSPSLSIIYSWF